jgi:hypothetical protein
VAKQRSSNEGSGGKLVDTWIYEFPAIEETAVGDLEDGEEPTRRVNAKKIEVELRLIKKFVNSTAPPLATKEVRFSLVAKEADIHLEGTDIEALRVALWDKLDKHYTTKWERFYLVEISQDGYHHRGIGTSITFNYSRVEKGTAWDGTLLMREYRSYAGEVISPWPGQFTDKKGRVIACIPASDENHKALEEFGRRIDALRNKLADFLRPEELLKTLANLSSNNLLPAPRAVEEGEVEIEDL